MKQALWYVNDCPGSARPLDGAVTAATVVVGGGITGLTTALRLAEAGQKVVVLESRQIGGGDTGNSTGNLYATLSQGLVPVEKKWDREVVAAVVAERVRAIDAIESTVRQFAIECQFERRPLYWCARKSDEAIDATLQHEYTLSQAAGLRAQRVDAVPGLSQVARGALCLENQAQFNPLSYVQGLARRLTELGGTVYENSPVTAIDARAGLVRTAAGEVNAGQIVLATHTPIGINLVQAEMAPFREYGISAVMNTYDQPERHPDGIIWIQDESVSVRSYLHNNRRYLVAVGQKHKAGEATRGEGYYQFLEAYLAQRYGVTEFTHRWSAQQFQSADLLPYIGRSGHDNVWVGTGYAADGLVWGAIAGDLIARQILGEADSGSSLYNPRRFTPVKSGAKWATENLSVASHFIRGYLTPARVRQLGDVAPGEGKIVSVDGERLAVFRYPDNELIALSPVCPHMKCMVSWNGADRTWDCPCHGSRFAVDGSVLEGPAMQALARHEMCASGENAP